MPKMTVTDLAELRAGDRITSYNGRPYRRPLQVTTELAPIQPGSPVYGVRVESPNPAAGIEWVLYPSQWNGREMEIERR